MRKIDIEKTLQVFQDSKAQKVDLAGLLVRSDVAHKWKVTYILIVVREGICWRLVDLLEQAYKIGQQGMLVGARILTRSAIETLCFLIYMNRIMQQVVENKMSFNDFENISVRLLLGSRKDDELENPVNIMTVIQESDKKYAGTERVYDELSETAHPNYDGICRGYTKIDTKKHETEFGDFWQERYPLCQDRCRLSVRDFVLSSGAKESDIDNEDQVFRRVQG